MMKTFSVKLKRDTCIEGVNYPADFQVGALTSEVGPLTLLGLLQFKHALLEEIVDGPDDDEDSDEDTSEDGVDGDEPGDAGEGEPTVEDQPGDGQSAGDNSDGDGELPSNPNSETSDTDTPTGLASFLAAGLDQNTAEALVVNNKITSIDELKALLADPDFDLLDLEEIGTVRAKKIKAIFSN